MNMNQLKRKVDLLDYTDSSDIYYIQYLISRSNGATVDEAYAQVVKVAEELELDCDESGSELGGSDE